MPTLARGGTQAGASWHIQKFCVVPEPACHSTSSQTPQEIAPSGSTADRTGKLFHELRCYLWRLAGKYGGEEVVNRAVADAALKMWGRLYGNAGGELAIPDAAPGGEGEV